MFQRWIGGRSVASRAEESMAGKYERMLDSRSMESVRPLAEDQLSARLDICFKASFDWKRQARYWRHLSRPLLFVIHILIRYIAIIQLDIGVDDHSVGSGLSS